MPETRGLKPDTVYTIGKNMKYYNTTGLCNPKKHYMIDLSSRIERIIEYIERGKYIDQHSPGQSGKTTLLFHVEKAIGDRYLVVHLLLGCAAWRSGTDADFAAYLVYQIHTELEREQCSETLTEIWDAPVCRENPWEDFDCRITELCRKSDREVVLILDESDHVLFSDPMRKFLSLLRDKYLKQQCGEDRTFKSVIVSSKYDTTGLKLREEPDKRKICTEPWENAVLCGAEMSYSAQEIEQMLAEYQKDHDLSFDAAWFASQIYDLTAGYPFYVSKLCMILDTKISKESGFASQADAWTERGFDRAVHILLHGDEYLYKPLFALLRDSEEFRNLLSRIATEQESVPFNEENKLIRIGAAHGWFKREDGNAVMANHLYEQLIRRNMYLFTQK